MSTPAERLRNRVIARARQQTPELGRQIIKLWDDLSKLSATELARAIGMGEILADPRILEALSAPVSELYFQQAISNMTWAASGLGVSFGVLNPEVIDSIRTLNLKMADSLKDDVREVVRAFVENGLRDGLNPRTIARRTRGVVGLTENQLGWVDNLEDELRRNSKAALNRQLGRGLIRRPDGTLTFNPSHAGGVGVSKRDMKALNRVLGTDERLTEKQITRIVGQYKKRLTAWHAESIARTATLDSLKNAQHQATNQAIQEGILPLDRMMSQWVTAGDDRVRDEHVAVAGDIVPFGTAFRTGEVIPGSNTYACRCVKRDFLARRTV